MYIRAHVTKFNFGSAYTPQSILLWHLVWDSHDRYIPLTFCPQLDTGGRLVSVFTFDTKVCGDWSVHWEFDSSVAPTAPSPHIWLFERSPVSSIECNSLISPEDHQHFSHCQMMVCIPASIWWRRDTGPMLASIGPVSSHHQLFPGYTHSISGHWVWVVSLTEKPPEHSWNSPVELPGSAILKLMKQFPWTSGGTRSRHQTSAKARHY